MSRTTLRSCRNVFDNNVEEAWKLLEQTVEKFENYLLRFLLFIAVEWRQRGVLI